MSEAEFQAQEALRLKLEEKKTAVRQSTPLPGTVEEFIAVILPRLNDAPVLQEYIQREHLQNKATVELLERHYERKLREQDLAIDGLEAEVAQLRGDVTELKDNFNVFASKMLKYSEERVAAVKRAAAKLEAELNR
jgi:uncharacterized coiled-coil protein SlyX